MDKEQQQVVDGDYVATWGEAKDKPDSEQIAEDSIRLAEAGSYGTSLGYLAMVKQFEEEGGVAGTIHEYEQEWIKWLGEQ